MRWRHAREVVLTRALTVLLLAAALVAGPHGASDPATAQTAPCTSISGPFHTRGAELLNAAGGRYIPYGINLVGLAHLADESTVIAEEARMRAAVTAWCANTVRLQVSQDRLILSGGQPGGYTVNPTLMSYVAREVAYARGLGLTVVLNLQTQTDAHYSREFMPTRRSAAFWKSLVARFGTDPNVMLDLFNEPAQPGSWGRWRNGFTRNGVTYLGLQQLASRVRGFGAKNVFWVEGLQRGSQLGQVWRYRLTHVGPVMYAEHRPEQPNTVATWRSTFGYLAEHNLAPVVVGEWAQYARSEAPWACWPHSPTTTSQWLSYLHGTDVGLIVTKLTKGQLIESNDFSDPTVFRSDWQCRTGLNEGAGKRIMDWFHLRNVPTRGRTSSIGISSKRASGRHGWRVTAVVRRDGRPWPGKVLSLEQKTAGHWHRVKTVRSLANGVVRVTYTRTTAANPPMRLHFPAHGMYFDTASRTLRLPRRPA